MAKNNNLTDFLTDVADAIREKKGTTDPINPQDFSAEITSISAGAKPLKDVNFFDYDGTILHSFTAAEFLALSAMPPLPTQEGLICQEWNWTYEAAREYVEEFGLCDIGATYITDDGKTRIYVHIEDEGRKDVTTLFNASVYNGVTVDWGDGTINKKSSHTYAKGGDYCITYNPQDDCTLEFGSGWAVSMTYSTAYIDAAIRKINIGKNVTKIGNNSFANLGRLQSITIPKGVTEIGEYGLEKCHGLRCLILPSSMTRVWDYSMVECYGLQYVSLNNGLTHLEHCVFEMCYNLRRSILPKAITIGNCVFNKTYSLEVATIPDNVTSIHGNLFANSGIAFIKFGEGLSSIFYGICNSCKNLRFVKFPSTIDYIGDEAFRNTMGALFYDFSKAITIPEVDTFAFDGLQTDCKIIVPDALYDSWITSTNWSSLADIIVKASEYNG